MQRVAWIVILLPWLGCDSRAPHGVRAPSVQASESIPRPHGPPPREIRELAAAVEQVPLSVGEPTHARVATALTVLADVVEEYDPAAARRVDDLATKLTRSPPRERVHASIVKTALEVALDAFATKVPADPGADLRDSYVAARRAQSSFSAESPMLDQIVELTAALRAITNVAAVLGGEQPVFIESEELVQLGYDPAKLAERAKRASAVVSELGRERRWKPAGQKAARALDALADVLEVAPLSASAAEWKSLVLAVRYEALQLEREGELSLDRSDRVKAGLLATVDGLERVRRESLLGPLTVLVPTARSAAEAIDEATPFVFQRAAIQEAFRTTADAYLLLSRVTAPAEPEINAVR